MILQKETQAGISYLIKSQAKRKWHTCILFKILQQSTSKDTRKEQRINPAHVNDIKDTE